MFWPSKLSYFYPYPENALSVTQGIFCGMVLVGITFISIKLIRKAPYFAVGWFWYLGTLVPVIGIFVQAGWAAMADRYAYIPLIGIFIIIAWGFPELIMNWRYKKKSLVTLVVIFFPLAIMTTWVQVSYWKNSIILYKHAIDVADKKYPGLARTHNNLGIALFAEQKNEEAISHYKMAIKLKPTHSKAHYNLGIVLFAEGKNEEAISHYKMAIKLKPNYTNAHYNLGIVLVQKGELQEAVHHFRKTIRLRPDLVAARDNLELALLRLQELE
jgi:tetratricopeptide (TPR) repeat protein